MPSFTLTDTDGRKYKASGPTLQAVTAKAQASGIMVAHAAPEEVPAPEATPAPPQPVESQQPVQVTPEAIRQAAAAGVSDGVATLLFAFFCAPVLAIFFMLPANLAARSGEAAVSAILIASVAAVPACQYFKPTRNLHRFGIWGACCVAVGVPVAFVLSLLL